MRRTASTIAVIGLVGCGGTTPPPEDPKQPPEFEGEQPPAALESTMTVPEEADHELVEQEPTLKKDDEEEEATTGTEPEFTEGMSVNEAIKAVPQGSERLNLGPEVLGKPLADPKVYAPCKLTPNQSFKLKVAVWDGRAVGIDISTKPKNEKVEQCVAEQVRKIEWSDKVKSLNTVDYAL